MRYGGDFTEENSSVCFLIPVLVVIIKGVLAVELLLQQNLPVLN